MNSHSAATLGAIALLALAAPAQADDGFDLNRDGVTWESGDGDLAFTLGGRLHLDSVSYDDGILTDDQTELRRARLELSGRIGDDVRFRLDREFTGAGGWRGAWVSYRPRKAIEVRLGNMIVPFSQEDLQSSNATPLMERSLSNALAPGYGVGIAGAVSGETWSVTGGAFGDGLADDDGRSRERGQGGAIRVTYAPLRGGKTVLHVGLAAEQRTPETGTVLRFQSDPEAAFVPTQLRTGGIAGVDSLTNLGLEGAFRRDRLLVQAQYIATTLDRSGAPELTFSGWYVQGSWIFGGRQREYNPRTGLFGAVETGRIRQTFELAGRYSTLEFEGGGLRRGTGRNATVGVNWYANDNLRLMADYVRAETSGIPLVRDRSANIFAVRLQVMF